MIPTRFAPLYRRFRDLLDNHHRQNLAALLKNMMVDDVLHELRVRAKLTQQQLAAKAGISVKTLYSVENAAPGANITLATLKVLAEAVGTTSLALMTPGKHYVEV